MKFPKMTSQQKNGFSMAYPDVCKVPAPPAPFVPVPYPNIVMAANKLNAVPRKMKVLQKQMTKAAASSGDEAGTLKGVVTSMTKMSKLFSQHSAKVKADGKKASMITVPAKASKLYPKAKKLQKSFEKQIMAECKKLEAACKDNPEQKKVLSKIRLLVSRAARGLNV